MNVSDYQGPDKELLAEYMKKRGFERPIEVWPDNMKAMLEI
jgi:hypothetical protein